jgi:diketogulonate reductase-like aldo/keto reductase
VSLPALELNDGNKIPQIGLGLWKVEDQGQFNTAFDAAIKAGYRHFDTAQLYKNENYLGEAWQASGVDREDLFITTKIWLRNFGYRHVHSSFEESLRQLQTEYVDLLLLHFPVTVLRKKAWIALEEIQAAGMARNIGVSNYTIEHLEEMKRYAKIVPAVNQVELHVFLQQPDLVSYCQERGIVIEAYSPLARAKAMDDPVILSIAQKYNKSYAQVMLRWLVEQDLVVIPKSVTPSRIHENIDIFDFNLDSEDLASIAGLDRDLRVVWNPTNVP